MSQGEGGKGTVTVTGNLGTGEMSAGIVGIDSKSTGG